MSHDVSLQKLQETKQRRTTDGHPTSARVTGGPQSRAPRVERAQEGRDAEMTGMHARDDGDCSDFRPVGVSSGMDDVSVSMKRRAEKVISPEDESRQIVTILMSSGLVLVLVIFKVAELFCEDRFGDAAVDRVCCAIAWDIENETQMKEVKRRVMDDEHSRMFDKMIAACWNDLECTRNAERMRASLRMDENRGRFLWMCLFPRHRDQMPVTRRAVRAEQVPDACEVLNEEQCGLVLVNDRKKFEFVQSSECTVEVA